jgi:hypothetical protein
MTERSDYFHAGNLDPIKDAPPNATADAHRRLEPSGTRGRLVIQF